MTGAHGMHVEVHNVTHHFATRGQAFTPAALVSVGFDLAAGSSTGLVGESGAGKTTLARAIVGLLPMQSGRITWNKVAIDELRRSPRWAQIRRAAQLVFQDPTTSLPPHQSVRRTLEEPLQVHTKLTPSERRARVEGLFKEVGLELEKMSRTPQQLSGGERQRVAIARALSVEPTLLVADEAFASVDWQLRQTLSELVTRSAAARGITRLFIGHDLVHTAQVCERVVVLLHGRVLEIASAQEVLAHPQHPYTQMLVALARRDKLAAIAPPEVLPPAGCVFHLRCPLAQERCRREVPVLRGEALGGAVACHLLA